MSPVKTEAIKLDPIIIKNSGGNVGSGTAATDPAGLHAFGFNPQEVETINSHLAQQCTTGKTINIYCD